MAKITIDLPDGLSEHLEQLGDRLPQLLQQSFQPMLLPDLNFPSGLNPMDNAYSLQKDEDGQPTLETQECLRAQIADLEVMLETVVEHSTELEHQLNQKNQQLQIYLADLENILETVVSHSTELEHQLEDKNQELLSYFREVEKVTAAAVAIEEDAYEFKTLADVAAREDQIGQLAKVFQEMVGQIRVRERKLTKRVQELTIEIDRTKQAQEVSQIVETEMFQRLQEQVAKLRRDRRKSCDD